VVEVVVIIIIATRIVNGVVTSSMESRNSLDTMTKPM
jgi:hypothetical protein